MDAAQAGIDLAAGDGAREDAESPIQQSLLGEQVYDLLWQRIVSHQLRPGDKLSDVRLSEELGVSRTPVREALQRLAQEGIVRAESRRGFFVAQFSSQDVREVYDVRLALEVLAVRLAFPHLTDGELAAAQTALDTVARRLQAGEAGAPADFLLVDRAFHELLIQAAHNRRLAAMMASLQAQLRVFQFYGIHFRGLTDSSIEQHRAILAALRRQDRAGAEQAMERHIQDVQARVLVEFAILEEDAREA